MKTLQVNKLKLIPFFSIAIYIFCTVMNLIYIGFKFKIAGAPYFLERALEMFNWNQRPFIIWTAITIIFTVILLAVSFGFTTVSVFAQNEKRRFVWDTVSIIILIIAFLVQIVSTTNFVYSCVNDARIINENSDITAQSLFLQWYLAFFYLMMIIPFVTSLVTLLLFMKPIYKKVFKREMNTVIVSGRNCLFIKGSILGIYFSVAIIILLIALLDFSKVLSVVLKLSDWNWNITVENGYGFHYNTLGYIVFGLVFVFMGFEVVTIAFLMTLFFRKETSERILLLITIFAFIFSIVGGIFILVGYIDFKKEQQKLKSEGNNFEKVVKVGL
jgi:hypothetical protein